MKALVLGSGARESALSWALDRAPSVSQVIAAPGNPGIARFGEIESCDPEDAGAVLALAATIRPDLIVIGPEAPLVAGVGGALREAGHKVFGPDRAAALIEGSKSHAKELMDRAGVPTGRWQRFTEVHEAVAFMTSLGPPYVVKADGLAAGKGVVVTESLDDAVAAVEDRIVRRTFGDAGAAVVIEEFLDGEETSLIALSDGRTAVICQPAQDYKRVFDGDDGPNTGGMGSYSPVPACPSHLADAIGDEIIKPMITATREAGAPFVGALYAGLALTSKGPKVVEFNARFGDPEAQALLPRLTSDFGEACAAAAEGDLDGIKLEWSRDACVTIVLVPGGYPGSHETGLPIEGVADAAALEGVEIFHAGTAVRDGVLVTSGGRVLAVSALGSSFRDARARAYRAASLIHFDNMHMRTDIALRAELTEREEA